MTRTRFSVFTATTTAFSAFALFILSYEMGLLPGGMFEDAAIGPVPLWAICAILVASLAAASVGTLLGLNGSGLLEEPRQSIDVEHASGN